MKYTPTIISSSRGDSIDALMVILELPDDTEAVSGVKYFDTKDEIRRIGDMLGFAFKHSARPSTEPGKHFGYDVANDVFVEIYEGPLASRLEIVA